MILNEMALDLKQCKKVLERKVPTYINHLIKCVVFKNTTNNLNHWVDEIATHFNEINGLILKGSNKKPSEDMYYDHFFTAAGDVEDDYRIHLRYFKNTYGEDYPPFEITDNLLSELYLAVMDFANYFSPIMAQKNNYTKDYFKNKLLNYFDAEDEN